MSSVQELNKNSIKFSLSTQIRSGSKSSQLRSYMIHNTANHWCRKGAKWPDATTLLTVTWTIVRKEQSDLIDNTIHYHTDCCRKGA